MKLSKNINKEYLFSKDNNVLKISKIGIEKESLRVLNSRISNKPHDSDLFGSPLLNKFITTDFSESLMELITPPSSETNKTLNFLDSLHQNVSKKISSEVLWPLSMPPYINSDIDIPIAYYGNSDSAYFKRVYRNGLSNRYGRQMQAIAGIHFNYSLDDNSLKNLFTQDSEIDFKEKSIVYFNGLRNLMKMNWLLLYLFGASPFVSKSLVAEKKSNFEKLNEKTLFMPYATSLRMSDIGYQNIKQKNLNISFNGLDEYIKDLKEATETPSKIFAEINDGEGLNYSQINSNILQIEDEYYSTARPKSSVLSNERMINKLCKYGVNYLELRSIDLNPFQASGINLETVRFLEIFILYCLVTSSPKISKSVMSEISNNDLLVSREGRKPGLKLSKNKKSITLEDWANQILDEMLELVSKIGSDQKVFVDAILNSKAQILEKDLTLSSQVFHKVRDRDLSYEEFGMFLGGLHKEAYSKSSLIDQHNEKLIEKEIANSNEEEKKLERYTKKSFDGYLRDYFG